MLVLPPNQQLAAPGKWPVVGEREPAVALNAWTVTINGLVRQEVSWSLDELAALPQVERAIDIHCVTRWSKLGCRFSGVLLANLIEIAGVAAEARFVSLVAHSPRQHSTSLPLEASGELQPLIALRYEGQPLARAHGGPVRVVVPGRYFYKSLEWLARIELLAADRLGYWEAEAGYHNGADPWREERYLAPAISRAEAAAVLATRDFRGRDLRSLDARGRDLRGLAAEAALLRDADFRGCDLRQARFDRANLSNAKLQQADLREASLQGADLEGAACEGADLRGANLRGASLLGATFVGPGGEPAATLDCTTLLGEPELADLAPPQAAFVRSQWAR